jgi:hypothetical protein
VEIMTDIKDNFNKFYDWLLECIEFNMEMIKYMDFDKSIEDELLDEYLQVEEIIERFYNKILQQMEYIKNEDCISRFDKIINSYYEEYYDVIVPHKRDIFYYSYLLGWYRDIPYELFIFATNLSFDENEVKLSIYE